MVHESHRRAAAASWLQGLRQLLRAVRPALMLRVRVSLCACCDQLENVGHRAARQPLPFKACLLGRDAAC